MQTTAFTTEAQTLLRPKDERVAFYAGSFDPITRGHWNIICSAIGSFDKVIVGVGINPGKKPTFTPEERVQLILDTMHDFMTEYEYRKITNAHFSEEEKLAYKKLKANPNVLQAISYEGLTIDAMHRFGSHILVRGERDAKDHEYEASITYFNQCLQSFRPPYKISYETITPDKQMFFQFVSSTSVKNLCCAQEYIAAGDMVTPTVHNKLIGKMLYPIFQKSSYYFGITNENKIKEEYDVLVRKYTDNRVYHNLAHVANGINYLNIYENWQNRLSTGDKNALLMALFYHDIEQPQNPNDKEAEKRSKEAMQRYIRPANEEAACKISSLIDATNHGCNDTQELSYLQQLMVDIDFMILASPGDPLISTQPKRYWQYVQKIRQEYAEYPIEKFAPGRIEVLKKILKGNIFRTPFFAANYETMAVNNVGKEIDYWQKQTNNLRQNAKIIERSSQ